MSEISVTVNGSTTINPTVGNGDVVNVTFSAAGERGPKGDTGVAGPANTIAIGKVVTGTDAAATLTGVSPSQTLNLTLPQGATGERGLQGDVGPAGPANSLSIGQVTKGDEAAATITGTAPSQVLSLTLPKGDKGSTGEAGPYTTIQVGTTTTGNPGTQAKVATVTSGDTVTLSFTVPRGVDGTANLADETPQPLGVASPGTAGFASRADHVHAVPTISYANLSGLPLAFTPAAHQHAVSDVTGLQTALDGKQAAGSYATLVGGTVPSSQLPGFVDDIQEYTNLAAFPATGEVGKLFVARDTNKVYRWSGSTYVEISASPGSTDAVPEGTTNLYFTTKRAADAAPVQSVNGKTGAVTIEAGGIAWSTVPTTTTTVTKAGSISYDENYLYVANAVDQWRRTAIEDWSTPTITVSVQPSNQTAVGNAATFSVTATATQNAELLHQWQRQAGGVGSWVNVAGGLSASLPLVDLSYAANNGDKYRVIITSGAAGTGGTAVNGWFPAVVVELTPTATVTSGEATLTVLAAISIVTQPQSVTLTSGTAAAFSISATTPGTGLAYQWQSSPDGTNWTNISGATSTSYSITGATQTGNDGYRYRCIVSSSGYDDATSNAAVLTVAPISVTTQPTNQTGAPVSGVTEPAYTASFTAAASSPAGAPTIQWQLSTDGGSTFSDVSGQTSSTISLASLTSADSGKRYRARFARSGWTNISSNAATLTVPTDVITVATQPSNTTASVSQFSSTLYTIAGSNATSASVISIANGKWFVTPDNLSIGDWIATSDNGVDWTYRVAALPFAGQWSKVLYGNGVYLTFLINDLTPGTWCATSTDGVSWASRQISGTNDLALYGHQFLTAGGGWFVAFNGQSGTSARWVQSQDGTNWTTVASTSSSPAVSSQFTPSLDNSQIVAWSPGSGSMAIASVDSSGVGQFSGLSGGFIPSDVIHDGTTFVAVTANSTSHKYVAGSWTSNTWAASFRRVAYRNGRYVAVASNGIASSNDAVNWVLRQAISTSAVDSAVGVTSGGFIVTTLNNTVWLAFTSPDGITWTQRTIGANATALLAVTGNKAVVQRFNIPSSGYIVDLGGAVSAAFSSSATTTFGAPAIQWQTSTDNGATWTDIAGATASPLSLNPVAGDNGRRYRARFTKAGYTAVSSNAAILTVP